ncbi:MAG: EamA family transporter [Patescibacteria group bacterium]
MIFLHPVFIFAFYAFAGGTGLLLLKIALSSNSPQLNWVSIVALILNPKFLIGFTLYVLGFLSWLVILSKFKLNFAFPVSISLLFIVSSLGSYFILNEPFNISRVAGIILCLIGIFLIAMK